jgi:predicted Rossmann fold flavoprotein
MRPLVVLGGGAAGFFAALRAKELAPDVPVLLLEATATPLQKVRISGGGRCNVTHHQFDPAILVTKYPRGAKELRGVLSRFGPRETMAWFGSRGVALKTEADGRVFPTTDDSETICQALLAAAREAGVELRTGATVTAATPELGLTLRDGSNVGAAALCIATGSNPRGLDLARALGHTIVPPVPSLFTFEVQDARLDGLAGVAVQHVKAKALVGGKTFEQEGPLLVTHRGLSAHAVLRLSAWAAREFHEAGYRATLVVDFEPDVAEEKLRQRVELLRFTHGAGTLAAHPISEAIPRRLWERLIVAAGGEPGFHWAEVPKRGVAAIIDQVKRARFDVRGKGLFKEEFVTAGGVTRSEVDWRTMQSRRVPGLFFAGEALDVDALTGGFNLQNAWSTGWAAGGGMAARASGSEA